MAVVDFRAAALMDEARAQSGLGDFGEDNFRPALATFVKACREDSYVDPAGLPDIAASIVRILVNRLRFEEILKRHSAILDEKIVTPLFIIGPGRVGSKKLHRLLANATNVQSTTLWQVLKPMPFPNTDPAGPDPRIAADRKSTRMNSSHQ